MAFSSTLPSHSFPSLFQFIELHSVNGLKFRPLIPTAFKSREPLHLAGKRKENHSQKRDVYHKRIIFEIQASSSSSKSSSSGTDLVLVSSLITVTLAVANCVLYKLALPMKDFTFFLAQFTSFGYVIAYFTILYIRSRAGIVTRDMMAIPKLRFSAIGFLVALGVASGISAGAILPGPVIPILSQTFLVWQLIFSTLPLGRRYSINQVAGCLLVATGVVVAIASGSNAGQMLSEVEFLWPALMIVSCAFQAGASIIKVCPWSVEDFRYGRFTWGIIEAARIRIAAGNASNAWAPLVLLLLPFLSNLKGIHFVQLPSYYKRAAGCFLNTGADTIGCNGAPFLPLLYITINVAFNISLLNVVKVSSAVVPSLLVMLSVPISVYILSLPLLYLPEGTALSPFFLLGCAILVCGLAPYKRGSKVE